MKQHPRTPHPQCPCGREERNPTGPEARAWEAHTQGYEYIYSYSNICIKSTCTTTVVCLYKPSGSSRKNKTTALKNTKISSQHLFILPKKSQRQHELTLYTYTR